MVCACNERTVWALLICFHSVHHTNCCNSPPTKHHHPLSSVTGHFTPTAHSCECVHSSMWRRGACLFSKCTEGESPDYFSSYLRMRGGLGGGVSHLSSSDWWLALSGLLSSWLGKQWIQTFEVQIYSRI